MPATIVALALALAHGAAEPQIGPDTSPGAGRQREAVPGNARHVCARYDAERAAYTGTVAVLEPAGGAATATADGAAYRLLVLVMHDEAPEAAPQDEALSGDRARAMPKSMMVLTAPGLAIIESSVRGRRGARSDGAYRCAPPQAPERHPLLFAHCVEGRAGGVDLERFPAPRAEVRLIQRALERAGMRPGPLDGIFGPRTLGALVRWTERDGRARERIVTYETLCPLIDTLRASWTP